MSKFARIGKVPDDFDVIEPTLSSLDEEFRKRSSETIQGNRRGESTWIVHQIDWQKTRYVHDLRFKYHRISSECYDYCVKNKIINAPLSKKWFEQGYERLCSLHAIDSRNFQFGGTSICRIPRSKLRDDQVGVSSIFNGCLGCGSGNTGVENIFGNKYGQRLAAIQVKREELEKVQEEVEEKNKRLKVEEDDSKKKKKKKDKKDKKKKGEEEPWALSKEEEKLSAERDEQEEIKPKAEAEEEEEEIKPKVNAEE